MENGQTNSRSETPEELINRLNLPLQKDLLLVSRALTHRSYLNEHPEALEDNERLEFLGDAVLDFVTGAWLYNHFPEMLEGDLTRMRSALVYTEQLAEYAREIDLGPAMRLGHGEVQAGGRSRTALLCDAFEALIGAIYLSGGISLVQEFIIPILERTALDVLANHRIEDPKSQLQEWSQAQGFSTPKYNTRSVSGPDHRKVFEVEVQINGEQMGIGMGQSKQIAAKEAARQALIQLGQISSQ